MSRHCPSPNFNCAQTTPKEFGFVVSVTSVAVLMYVVIAAGKKFTLIDHPGLTWSIFMVCTLLLASSGIGFWWTFTCQISSDALTAALLGLAPAIQAVLAFPVRRVIQQMRMRRCQALDPRIRKFTYFSVKVDGEDTKLERAVGYFHEPPFGHDCQELDGGEEIEDGGIVEEARSAHVILIKDITNGLRYWWWRGVVSAGDIVAKPRRVNLEDRKQCIFALSVLADIIQVGELVILAHHDLLYEMVGTDEMQKALAGDVASTTDAILEKLRFDSWRGSFVEDRKRSLWLYSRARRFSLLFCIVACKTKLFTQYPTRPDKESKTAFVILANAKRLTNPADWKEDTGEWLRKHQIM